MKEKESRMGTAVALGITIGTALGVAYGNMGAGFFWGMVVAVILNAVLTQQGKSDETE